MTEFVRFELDDGTSMLFEATDGGVTRVRGTGSSLDGGSLTAKVAEAAQAAHDISTAIKDRVMPDELDLELGFKLSGQAQWFVARSQAEASLKVTLKWKKAP